MRLKRRKLALLAIPTLLGFTVFVQFAIGGKKDKQISSTTSMDEHKRAVHALNRLTFGPRPGDVERVMTMGVDKWIDEQLRPEKIDDSALEVRLAPFRTLSMHTDEIVENFPPRQLIKAIEGGKDSMPSGQVKRAVYEAQLLRYQEKQEKKEEKKQVAMNASPANNAGEQFSDSGAKTTMAADDELARTKEDRLSKNAVIDELMHLSPDQRMKEIFQMSTANQLAFSASLKGDRRDKFMEAMNPEQREIITALNNPEQVVSEELVQGKLLRATYSERQLQEVMTDFWFNHFNVFIGKDADRFLITSYERDVIRPHAMGKFEDLLTATAQSPAMLYYLDNWLSVGPNSDVANGIGKRGNKGAARKRARQNGPVKQSKGKRNGLNENYGRELMELHTLDVNGGYTQYDVTEVARVLTGWTIKQPKDGAAFKFDERMHEPGEKIVLGHHIKANGQKEGFEVLHILAHHPATAKFICTKLAMRFVSDTPPPQLIDRMTQTFLKKDGDIREVLRTMLRSPEFWSTDTYRAKVKTPLEFVVSSLRASGAEVTDAINLSRQLQNLGMPLYGMQPPTGYSMKADAWVNSSALLGRMNFALALTAGKLKGVQVSPERAFSAATAPSDPMQTLAVIETSLLDGDVSKQTHDTIAARLEDPTIAQRKLDDPAHPPNVGAIAGLILGSPEFQKR
ncbi:MAG TPA: DUF1800 domain-containing protein [Terriglobales bacterium]|nr:DUF1800 domain-containing protein [Terriglobales bacterium]